MSIRRFSGRRRRVLRTIALVLAAALPAFPQWGGFGRPLTLGIPQTGGAGPLPTFRPWLSVSGSYFHNLNYLSATGESLSSQNRDSYGGGASAGVVFSKALEHGGVAGAYTAATAFGNMVNVNGISQVGSLQYSHQIDMRNSFGVGVSGGSSNGGYGYGAGFGGAWGMSPGMGSFGASMPTLPSAPGIGFQDPNNNGLVDNEAFDNRATFGSVGGSFQHRFSMRWTGSVAAGSGIARRSGSTIAGTNSTNVSGQVGYQISERLTLGVGYSLGFFNYPGMYGGNRVQSAGMSVQYQLDQRSSIFASVSGYYFRSNFIGSIAIDPALAEILGVSTVTEVQEVSRWGPSMSAGYTRAFRIGSMSVAYTTGISPGNGVVLASKRDNVVASYGVGFRRFSVGASSSYSRFGGITGYQGKQDSWQASGSISTRVWGILSLSANGGYRTISVGIQERRPGAFATVGITFSPREIPIGF